MAEIKNTFLKSKMNKDLDDRILPNGEYRDARNISVGRSEDSDVGALENIIGNSLVAGTDIGNGLTIIGIENNNSTDQLFVFLTDYTDPVPTRPTNAPPESQHYIYSYNENSGQYVLLVKGNFLNFSTTNRIIGINLIENLLFWTDNRNQPRKININLAGSPVAGKVPTVPEDYYSQEHQISVSKYNPYQAIKLYNRLDTQIERAVNSYFVVSGDRVAEFTPYIGATVVSSEAGTGVSGNDYIKVTSVLLALGDTRVFISPDWPIGFIPDDGDYVTLIKSTMSNKNEDLDWPGDPDYLEDKFVRFSYRFKFDDNEYSIMAPFTQIAYIPKQYGFFLSGDEDATYQSTVVSFMENLVQNIGLIIPLPSSASRLSPDYKISELEILFRESDSVAIKVLESIPAGEISGKVGLDNYYTYDYQSRKPHKTLPEAQTIRVYDRVPVRAFAQETSGNRIIYGNYRDQHTPPATLNYNCRIAAKASTGVYNNWIEYPNHTVKRNRNYQIGFVLSDKFGRQSPVILSSVDAGITSGGQFYAGSTIYSPYDITADDTSVKTWFGDAIKVIVNSRITSNINSRSGTPGLYAVEQQDLTNALGFAVKSSGINITNTTYTFRLDDDPAQYPLNINIPKVGDSLRGNYEDFVKVTEITGPTGGPQSSYTVTTTGRVNDVYLRADDLPNNTPDIKFAYTINDLGWYSYKIVVKQTQQEYYNVYLPGILNGYPGQSGGTNTNGTNPTVLVPGGVTNGVFPTNETNKTAFTTLFNDNINKIPRDLQEVGPDQKQFRSSVTLYGRVTNTMGATGPSSAYNAQYYARLSYLGKNAVSHTSTAIARAKDVNMGFSELSEGVGGSGTANIPIVLPATESEMINTGGGHGNKVFYQLETNPLIARISTVEKSIGASAVSWEDGASGSPVNQPPGSNMNPFLAVYETSAVESLLNIYWETTSEGLIVDLNTDVASGSGGAVNFNDLTWQFDEYIENGDYVTPSFFYPVNEEGSEYNDPLFGTLVSVTNGNDVNSMDLFELEQGDPLGSNANKFQIRYVGDGMVFRQNSDEIDVYEFTINIETDQGFSNDLVIGGIPQGFGALKNLAPTFDDILNVTTTRDVALLLPGTDLDDNVYTNNQNGTIMDPPSNREDLLITFEPIQPGDPGGGANVAPTGTDEGAWVMNEITGTLTQGIPDETTGFSGNSNGTYGIKIYLTDANNDAGTGDYAPMVAWQNVMITLGYVPVNVEAISACVLAPQLGVDNDLLYNIKREYQWNPNTAQWVITSNYYSTSGIYFLADTAGGDLNAPQIEPPEDNIAPLYNDQPPVPGPQSQDYPSGLNPTMIFEAGNSSSSNQAHTSGTIVLSLNVFMNTSDPTPGVVNRFTFWDVNYYYRIQGDLDWISIPRELEYNRVGTVGGNDLLKSPTRDNPFYGIQQPNATQPITWQIKHLNNKGWYQAVRAFDYGDFGTEGKIEYAVVIENFRELAGSPDNPVDRAICWLVTDDLHYPSCVPWQGENLVTLNAPNISFKYYRSEPSNESTTYQLIDVTTSGVVYAETPYGDYVNQFYEDEERNSPYKPAQATPYINYTLNAGPEFGVLPWSDPAGNSVGPLQWVAGYGEVDGIRLTNPSTQLPGVNSVQTTLGIPFVASLGVPEWAGTLRIKTGTD